jgi:Cys-tRNA(Pro)/Cys-tRNA(Cys) deacylase
VIKTNVMRLLDIQNVHYVPHEYDPELVDGGSVAKALNQDPEAVFKSLVCVNEKKEHFIFEVPVNCELDLKKAAKASSSKSIEMIHQKELLPLTGYIHGGCSPIGLKKEMKVFIDETAEIFDTICISAGRRGFQVELSPFDLSSFVKGTFVDLIR